MIEHVCLSGFDKGQSATSESMEGRQSWFAVKCGIAGWLGERRSMGEATPMIAFWNSSKGCCVNEGEHQ
jgi:hypothetical protein